MPRQECRGLLAYAATQTAEALSARDEGWSMGEWNRSTREIAARALSPEMVTALEEHATRFGVDVPLDECVMCVETVSEKRRRRLFGRGGPRQTTVDAAITSEWFATIARADDSDVPVAMTVRLREATVRDFRDLPISQRIKDNGVHVSGLFTGRVGMQGNASTETFVPLGDEPVSDRFKNVLLAAVQSAKS